MSDQLEEEQSHTEVVVDVIEAPSLKRKRLSEDDESIQQEQQELPKDPEEPKIPLTNGNHTPATTSTTEIPEWFVINTKQAEQDRNLRLKELKDELMSELSHQLENTLDRIVKNDKLQLEKQIMNAMKHCFLDVETELACKNLKMLKNGSNHVDETEKQEKQEKTDKIIINDDKENNGDIEEGENFEDDDNDKEEGEIKSTDPEEKTDSQKDNELVKKLNNILNDLTPNDNKKIYGLFKNLKVSTKNGVKIVMDLFFEKVKKMPKLSYELVDRLINITDFDPAFLHLREYLLRRCENDLANGSIADEIIFVSFIARKGYLLPDSFVSRCIYYFTEIESKENIKCLCEFVNIAGEYYRNFPFIIDCFNKLEKIAAAGLFGKDITDEINQLIYRKNMLWS